MTFIKNTCGRRLIIGHDTGGHDPYKVKDPQHQDLSFASLDIDPVM